MCCAAQRGWLLSLGSCNFHLLLRGSPTHKYILFCCSEYRNSAISTKCKFLFVHWLAKGFHPHNVPYNFKDQGRLRITDMCFIWGLTISFMVEERCCVLTLSMREKCVGQEATISGADTADLLEDHQNRCWCPQDSRRTGLSRKLGEMKCLDLKSTPSFTSAVNFAKFILLFFQN